MTEIDRTRLAALTASELDRFVAANPKSKELYERARKSLIGGVPMPWMMRWAGGFPVFAKLAIGARIIDVDDHTYIDFCLGDTGAMPGHDPEPVVRAITDQERKGITTMLPTADAPWVGEELTRRFGLDRWMFTLTATDANRAALRICRQVTGRPKVLVMSYSYHGSVDEAFAVAGPGGTTVSREGNVGPPVDPSVTTVAVEFNDLEALERALATEEIACVLAEPVMTNMGIVLPDEGYHDALRSLTRQYGTLLIIDETHTFSAGPGGCTAAWGLEPDLLSIGKAIGSGVPAGALGMTEEVVEWMFNQSGADYEDTGGVGGTLAGNALSLAAVRATLSEVLSDEAFAHTIPLATRFSEGVMGVVEEHGLPWNVTQLGARAEYRFEPEPARNGTQAHEASDPELERFLHLHALNRGVLITPFHNMALMSPATSEADVDRHTEVFREAVADLLA
ncbi:MAG: aspartate aminotransferase family protein [Solirubrobacterales bacterium]|nr:aspartate aminotransferase family protein [Solirubrobacterales bacterium]OJU96140.1 MAG: aspartate aminotransferase family protein [Solirubrobacterales bacterium 67-14]